MMASLQGWVYLVTLHPACQNCNDGKVKPARLDVPRDHAPSLPEL